jgi:hypothetical protein
MKEKKVDIVGWKYYNHAAIPTVAPFEEVNIEPVNNGNVWKLDGKYPLFARWTSDFDCGYETQWWYCLKDDEYRIDKLNSNDRYKITKGRKKFEVKQINFAEWIDDLAMVQYEAFKSYPVEYRQNKTVEEYKGEIKKWHNVKVFGAFNRENNKLCGYTLINEYDLYCDLTQQKVIPEYEKLQINAALVDGVLLYLNNRLKKGYMIVDCERNIMHKTEFPSYLIKYFGFRYAYCKLNIKYRNWVGVAVKMLYPFRKQIYKMKNKILYNVGGALKMEEIRRTFKN